MVYNVMKHIFKMILSLALLIVALGVGSCGSSGQSNDDRTGSPAPNTAPTSNGAAGAVSDDAAAAFGSWYRAAVAEGGDVVPARLAESNPASLEEFKGLIRILCALDAPDTPKRRAAAETIKDDPEFFGDVTFAASAIAQARISCSLEN